jgi:hypothetical protein
MKNTMRILILLLLASASLSMTQSQDNKFVVTASGNYFFPVGTLGDRFKATTGGSIGFGQEVNKIWTWIGKFEYFKFTKVNDEKLFITRKITTNNVEKEYTIPIPKLTMDLEVGGVSANAIVKLADYDFIRANMNIGFGIYNWRSDRSAYYDSVYAVGDSSLQIFAGYLDVPAKEQMDWSGGITAGINVDINVYGPAWITLGGSYKIIMGELWPTLKLDLENVSGFQMGEISGGIKVFL